MPRNKNILTISGLSDLKLLIVDLIVLFWGIASVMLDPKLINASVLDIFKYSISLVLFVLFVDLFIFLISRIGKKIESWILN